MKVKFLENLDLMLFDLKPKCHQTERDWRTVHDTDLPLLIVGKRSGGTKLRIY